MSFLTVNYSYFTFHLTMITPKDHVYPQIVEYIDAVQYMDAKNIAHIINGYLDYSISKPFLALYLSTIGKMFDDYVIADDSRKNVYIVDYPDADTFVQYDFDLSWDNYALTNTFSIQEHWLVCQLIQFLTSLYFTEYKRLYPIEYTYFTSEPFVLHNKNDLLLLKIQKSTAFINNDGHNSDPRSTLANDYKYNPACYSIKKHIALDKRITNEYDIYFPEGFTIEDYLIAILKLRGCIYDRWYTLFSGVEKKVPSKIHPKVNKSYSPEECLYLILDHGS